MFTLSHTVHTDVLLFLLLSCYEINYRLHTCIYGVIMAYKCESLGVRQGCFQHLQRVTFFCLHISSTSLAHLLFFSFEEVGFKCVFPMKQMSEYSGIWQKMMSCFGRKVGHSLKWYITIVFSNNNHLQNLVSEVQKFLSF